MQRSLPILAVCSVLTGLVAPSVAQAATYANACGKGSSSKTLSTGPWGLAGFSLRFGNNSSVFDDHKIKRIGIHGGLSTVTAMFADNDGNDHFCWDTWHERLPAGTRAFDAAMNCSGICDVTIEPPRTGEVFVLQGFELELDRDDVNVRRLLVDPEPARRRVRVELSDNGTVHYEARIQYAYVPGTAVVDEYTTSDVRREDLEYFPLPRRAGKAVLQGFQLDFRNGDHYLGMVRIEPRTSDFRIVYRDKNFDDDYNVTIDYAILR